MEVGVTQVMQSWGSEGMSDARVYEGELKIALNADEQGFDHVRVVEHHFEDDSLCPDNFVYLACLASAEKPVAPYAGFLRDRTPAGG